PGQTGLTALSGGEALPRDLAEALLAGGVSLWNGYGPTEAAIYTTAGEVRPGAGPVGMGRPLDNVRLFIVDRSLAPVPVGVPGELWIGGAGLARGYLGRPELTAAAFVPDPFSGEPGARLYRTGDRVRYRSDGTLEFLGRLDHQVKIRGHRVEPGEIEAGLCRHPAVAQALVTARGEGIEHRLVVYWIAREGAVGPDAAELRAFLRTLLPEPLVPSAFVRLPAFPASPTGKVDRGALAEPESMGEERAYRAPHGPVEERLARLWAELLGIERVGADDDFFALGGHSLLATRLVSRLRQTEGVELPVRQLFAAPTPARLAAVLQKVGAAGERSAGSTLRPAPRPAELPLSYAQERLWFVEQMERDDSLHSMPSAFRLRGDLAIPVLAASLGEIVRRHEALRTRFAVHGGRPVQVIDADWRPGLPLVDLGGLPQETATAELDRRMAGEEALSFDLAKGPLLRITLIRCVDDFVLLVTFHHLVADGWSIGVFLHELAEIYRAFHQGKPSPLPELPLQYADFALWQREWLRGDILARQLEYWQGKLAGLTPLDLPADRPAVPGQAFPAGHHSFILAARCTAHIDRFRRQGMSPFMVLLAAFQALLHRHTGQTDIAVGVPIANRNRHEIEGLIGFFVNTLVLRTKTGGPPSFQALLARVRETTLAAFDHQDLPFARLVEALRPDRRQGSLPLVDVMLTLEGTARPASLPGVELTVLPYRQGVDLRIDAALSLHFLESAGELSGWLGYNTKRFDRTTAARWRDHFLNLLAAAVETPDGPLGELPLLGAAERHQVQVEWGEGGERVRAGDRPASIGIWGEMAERGRFRRRADGSLEAWGSARSPAAGPAAPGAVTPDTLAQKQAALASRRESLSATKQALLDRLLRGQAPTRPAAARTAPAFLVKLHSGAPGRSPLFLTHAMGGAVFSYAELARRLGAQPAYGVQSPALESGTPIDDLPAMAAAYVAAVEAAAPSGPLLLGGWSFGGVVAFEMACQLAARGREVALLALFDSWTPALVQPPAEVDEAELHRLFLADQGGAESPPDLHAKPLQAVLDVYRANLRAYATYRPRPYPGRLTLFRPLLAPEETRPHPTNGWEALTREPIEVYTVPGDHFSMLAPPHVDRLAAGLSGAIEAADRIEEAG
ncbi:MAG TPA: condensation domain-containing protein, partial [Thermoanaerobaculia bacterium]|nr:condensation domain-containing protein [Thermoanaerobaculia bacterium]